MERILAPLLILGLVALIGGVSFWLGWNARQTKNNKFNTSINTAYQTLIEQNRKMQGSPNAVARSQGYSEGYEQGVADSHNAIERLIRSDLPDDQQPPTHLTPA